ncbi:MAG: VOC family protein [Candidatus Obscuribacterales bacterium]|nr:VOC family protein [Candidatus Obscuribacterales bacterium]
MPASTGIKVSALSYIILYVGDTNKAAEFYRDKLGLEIKVNHPGWAELKTGDTTLALHQISECANSEATTTTTTCASTMSKAAENSPYMVFNVDNIKEAYATLKDAGIKFDSEPRQVCEEGDQVGLSADFTDLDGNRLSIFSMVAK